MSRAAAPRVEPSDSDRPSPEALLERYGFVDPWSTRKRGRLRVLLGAAPGVGKTYAMLREGHRLRDAGRDVVVGYVEPHGRAETAEQIGDLETIPRRRLGYRGVTLEEMDIDAILARKPRIALIDELAHANIPGSTRAKRYEDVEDLRDAGIDVITTMNVQHLESQRDVVAGITGIAMRETVPDRVLDDADVQVIDLPTDALLDRLAEGKIFPPQRARQAAEHFFQPGNLMALRELALRHTAAGVDDLLEQFMRETRPEAIKAGAERVLVLLDDDPDGSALRGAWRLAGALRCDLIGATIHAARDGDASPDERRHVERNARLAEDLGATVVAANGQDSAHALAEAAREQRATMVVLARQPTSRWRFPWQRSLADRLLDILPGVDLYLVERGDQAAPPRRAGER